MNQGACRGVLLGLALLTASVAPAEMEPAARVKKAQQAARANAASSEGRDWKRRNSPALDRLLIPLLNGCVPDGGDTPTAFSVYLRLSAKGRVSEIVTNLDPTLGECMSAAGRELKFPEAPREDYWVQLNMAAPL